MNQVLKTVSNVFQTMDYVILKKNINLNWFQYLRTGGSSDRMQHLAGNITYICE